MSLNALLELANERPGEVMVRKIATPNGVYEITIKKVDKKLE